MVKSMTYARTVPHFNLHEEYNLSNLIKIRNDFNKY